MQTLLSPKMERSEWIIEEEIIRASVGDVFRSITNAKIIDEWGGGPARLQPKPGGRWFFWDGEMFGMVKEVDYPKKFVFTLREAHWDMNYADSVVEIKVSDTGKGTLLSLKHSQLPNRRIRETHREGWCEYYIGPIKAYLENR